MQGDTAVDRSSRKGPPAVAAALLGAALLWATWPIWRNLTDRWSHDPRYAHGYLVPLFAGALLWLRRGKLAEASGPPSWWGLPLILAGAALQLGGVYFFYESIEDASLLFYVAGACVLLAGSRSLRWSWPAIAFLAFMLPLPYRLEGAMAHPLQKVGTKLSTYALQTLGFPAIAEGNVIHIEETRIGVVEACGGLGMIFTFIAMAAGVAMLIRRPLMDRLIVVASAIPIAILVNVLRITSTGVVHRMAGSVAAGMVFHDFAGWLMMPVALALLWLELAVLAHLLVEPGATARVVVPTGRGDLPRGDRTGPEAGPAGFLKRSMKTR